ncbi:MAG: FAD-binding domain-containing protein [Chakrabartia godavariana]
MEAAHFPLTRADALKRLDDFVAGAAESYGARRNHVDAAGVHAGVSRLSAALRRRLISEEEVVRAVLAVHPYATVETYIAEVFWRTYWKGWLERHRELWPQVQDEILTARTRLETDAPTAARYRAAIGGATGIHAFDHWADELSRTGYLHNWARMQVASIWIFTLGLPWQLGADWMFAHLVDADPASNTLSWRWVAGLHTAGKAYLADAARIANMTDGALTANRLATRAVIPSAGTPPDLSELRDPLHPDGKAPSLILLTCEDLSLETQLDLEDVRGIVTVRDLALSDADHTALADAARRAAQRWPGVPCKEAGRGELAAIARDLGCAQIVTGFAPAGPVADGLRDIRKPLADQGIAFAEHLRRWDRLAWPFCAKGFFQLKSRIPALLQEQGIVATS